MLERESACPARDPAAPRPRPFRETTVRRGVSGRDATRTRETHTCLDESPDVNSDRDVVDVPCIVLELLLRRERIGAIHVRPARDTSEHVVAEGHSRRVPIQILDKQRCGPRRTMSLRGRRGPSQDQRGAGDRPVTVLPP
jgi:hypothetical protein